MCEAIARGIGDAGSTNLKLGWLKEDLIKARSALAEVDVEIVESLRRQRKDTTFLLDSYVIRAKDAYQIRSSGVFDCIDALTDHFSGNRDTAAVLNLEKLRKHSRITLRTLWFMTRPKLAFLLSWRCLLLITVGGLIAACSLYVGHYAIHPRAGLTASESVTAGAASDVKRIQEVAQDPTASLTERSLKTVTAVAELLPKIPKAILAITAAIAAFQGLLAALVKPSKSK